MAGAMKSLILPAAVVIPLGFAGGWMYNSYTQALKVRPPMGPVPGRLNGRVAAVGLAARAAPGRALRRVAFPHTALPA